MHNHKGTLTCSSYRCALCRRLVCELEQAEYLKLIGDQFVCTTCELKVIIGHFAGHP